VDNKTIGELKFFSSCFMAPLKDIERTFTKELGGGGVLELVYFQKLAKFMLYYSKIKQIKA
jgi:hypothetical protein